MRKILRIAWYEMAMYLHEYLRFLVVGAIAPIVLGAVAFARPLWMPPATAQPPPPTQSPELIAKVLSSGSDMDEIFSQVLLENRLAPLGLVDRDGLLPTPEGERKIETLSFPDENSAHRALADGEIDAVCVAPLAVGTGQPVTCTVVSLSGAALVHFWAAELPDNTVSIPLYVQEAQRTAESITWEFVPVGEIPPAPDADGSPKPPLALSEHPPLFILVVLLAAGMTARWLVSFTAILAYSFLDEKRNRTLEVMLVSLSGDELLLAKLLARTFMAVFAGGSILSLLGSLRVLIRLLSSKGNALQNLANEFVLSPSSLLWMLVFLVGGYMLYGLFWLVTGALSTHPDEIRPVEMVSVYVLFLVSAILTMTLLSKHPPLWARVLYTLPLLSPILQPLRLLTQPPSGPELWFSALLLWGSLWLAYRLSGHYIRVNFLLDDVSRLPRWLPHRKGKRGEASVKR